MIFTLSIIALTSGVKDKYEKGEKNKEKYVRISIDSPSFVFVLTAESTALISLSLWQRGL